MWEKKYQVFYATQPLKVYKGYHPRILCKNHSRPPHYQRVTHTHHGKGACELKSLQCLVSLLTIFVIVSQRFLVFCFVVVAVNLTGLLAVAFEGQQNGPDIPTDPNLDFTHQSPVNPRMVPCDSVDAQYPSNPCSPREMQPALEDYAPPYHTVPMIPQAAPRPVFPQYSDYNRYPYANEKQIDGI